MKNNINIAIVDDHQVVIDGLKLMLGRKKNFKIVLESSNSMKMLLSLEKHSVDILLTDIMMPTMNGYELSLMVKKKYPHIKIIALSMNGDGALIQKMIDETDIKGYLLKTASPAQFVDAIETVAQGGVSFQLEVLEEVKRYSILKH